jgi:hypothetical protein
VGWGVRWSISTCGDFAARVFAVPHYSRQSPDGKLGGPARQLVLTIGDPILALWISTYTLPEYTDHRWPGAWQCTMFRNNGGGLASDLIREAVSATRACWGDPPELGMITFVDADKVRHKRDPGRCYLRAGFARDGKTQGGLLCFRMTPTAMPLARAPAGYQYQLFPTSPTRSP